MKRKMMIRRIAMLLAFSLIFTGQALPVGANSVEVRVDNSAKERTTKNVQEVIKSIEVKRTSITVGEEQEIRITLSEKLNKEVDSIQLTFIAEDATEKREYFYSSGPYSPGNTILLTSYMDEYDISTTWIVDELYVAYSDDTYEFYSSEEFKSLINFDKFKTTGTEGQVDYKKPIISDIKVDSKDSVTVGESIKVSCKITDDMAKQEDIQATVDISIPLGGGSSYTKTTKLKYNSSTKRFEYELPILKTTVNGTYIIESIEASDGANSSNESIYTYIDVITDVTEDNEKPIIKSVSVEEEPNDNYRKTIIVDVKDNFGYIYSSGIEVNYKNDKGEIITFTGFSENEGMYTTELYIYNYESSNYYFDSITVTDPSYNTATKTRYDKDFSYEDFRIVKYEDLPNLKKVSFTKNTAILGDTVGIEVELNDKFSLTEKVSLQLWCDNKQFTKDPIEVIYDKAKGKYIYNFKINSEIPSGEWRADIYLFYEGNEEWVGNANNLKVTGTGKTMKDFEPSINRATRNKRDFIPGEVVNIDVVVDPKIYDVTKGSLYFSNIEKGNRFSIESKSFDKNTNTLKFSYTVPSDMNSGLCKVTEFDIETDRDNFYFWDSEITKLKSVSFAVNNESLNNEDATLSDIKVDKTIVNLNQELKISAKFSKNNNLEVFCRIVPDGFSGYTGNLPKIAMTYNKLTGYYEGKVKIDNTMPSTNWRVYEVALREENTREEKSFLTRFEEKCKFKVTGTELDKTPPVFNGITVNRDEVVNGDKVKISIDIEDKESGIKKLSASYHLKDDYNYDSKYLEFTYNNTTKKYEAEMLIDSNMKRGKWILGSIMVESNNDSPYVKNDYSMYISGVELGKFIVK